MSQHKEFEGGGACLLQIGEPGVRSRRSEEEC